MCVCTCVSKRKRFSWGSFSDREGGEGSEIWGAPPRGDEMKKLICAGKESSIWEEEGGGGGGGGEEEEEQEEEEEEERKETNEATAAERSTSVLVHVPTVQWTFQSCRFWRKSY